MTDTKGAGGGLAVRAAARLVGCDEKLLRKLIAARRLTRRADGLLEPDQFATEWADYQRSKRPSVRRPDGPTGSDEGYRAARTRRETFAALIAELDYDVRMGRLIDRETVRAHAFATARRARDLLLGIPDRIGPQLVGITDVAEARAVISDEVRRVCEELSRPPEWLSTPPKSAETQGEQ